MSESIAAHVVRSLSGKTGLPATEIQASTELLSNLGLDGDDAAEFFEELRKHFGPDLSELQKDWSRYFRPEPTLLTVFRFGRRKTLVPITVEAVIHAVERGCW
jgi:hypothetical protein